MGIEVVRFHHQSWRSPDVVGASVPATLLFDPRLERGAERTIGDRYRRLEAGPRSADLVIVRGSDTDIAELVEKDKVLAEIREGKPTMVLAPESVGLTPTLHDVGWSESVPDPPSLEHLREAEILCGLYEEQAIYRQGGVHYLLPNALYHAEAFVRLGDSLNDQIDLFRLSDWLIERVQEDTALLADNGSMLSLLTTLGLRVQQARGYSPKIATLDEYPIAPSAIVDAVDRIRLDPEGQLLFMISVNSSGRVAREVANLSGIKTEVVLLCETAEPANGDFERFSRYPVERWEVDADGRCERCPERHLLAVSPRSYELRTAIKLQPVGLHIREAAACSDFWEAAQHADAVRLHVEATLAKGSAKPTRHLAVEIDIAKMLASSELFRERCLQNLATISPPDLVLIPDHGASGALAALIREAFPDLAAEKIVVVEIGPDAPDLQAHLEGVAHVLIVDDTLVSGSTVVGLRRLVHRASVELGGVAVTIFVPLSRPADQDDHRRVSVTVQPSREASGGVIGGLHCAQEVLLPDGGECPWCRERTMLEEHLESLSGESREFAVRRREQLAKGELEAPLLPCGGEEEGTIVGSFFGDLKPIAAVAAVSAHAQRLRDEMERIREDETIRVLDVPLILQAFFDPIIVATMLRTLPPRDLRDAPSEHVVARTIRANLSDYPAPTIAELALATIEGKLPVKPVRELLESHQGAWAEAYLQILAGY